MDRVRPRSRYARRAAPTRFVMIREHPWACANEVLRQHGERATNLAAAERCH